MSLDPLQKEFTEDKYQKYSQKNTLLKNIKDLVYQESNTVVSVKITSNKTLVLICESASAASNLLYQSDELKKRIQSSLNIEITSIIVKVKS